MFASRGFVGRPMDLAPLEREWPCALRAKERAIRFLEQRSKPLLGGRPQHHHACAFLGRELAIVDVIAIECDDRATELTREAIVLDIARPAELFVFETEEDVPARPKPHELDDADGNVCVGVNPRNVANAVEMRCQFAREGSHAVCFYYLAAGLTSAACQRSPRLAPPDRKTGPLGPAMAIDFCWLRGNVCRALLRLARLTEKIRDECFPFVDQFLAR